MTQQEVFEKMELLIPYHKKLRETQGVILPVDMQMMLKEIWDTYWGFPSLNLGCPNCIIDALSIVDMNYEREYPKYVSTLITSEPENNEVIEPTPKQTTKNKSNGKN